MRGNTTSLVIMTTRASSSVPITRRWAFASGKVIGSAAGGVITVGTFIFNL